MKKIKRLVHLIDEELEGAKNYAEMYIDNRASGGTWASKFKAMAEDELNHATTIHDYTVGEIGAIREVYTPPESMMEKWNIEHKHYIEEVAMIKTMLNNM